MDILTGGARAARRVLAFAAVALLSFVAAPRAEAQNQNDEWLEVQGSTSITIRRGESRRYYIRLKKPPIKMDRDTGAHVLDGNGNTIPAGPNDPWWVRVTADGAVRADGGDSGHYDVDGDGTIDLSWIPSIGRPFHSGNWNQWVDINITAHTDVDTAVVFAHEVWSNDTWCPEHGVGRVTVTTTDEPVQRSAWELQVSPTSLTVTEGDTAGRTYRVGLDSAPSSSVVVTVGGHSGTDVTVEPPSLTFTPQNWEDDQDVRVTADDDVDAENEEVTLTHTANGDGYTNVAGDDVTVRIDDDETASNRVTLTVNPTEVSESVGSSGRSVTVTATLNNAPRTTDTEVTVSVDPETASAGDFEAVQDFTLTIDDGEMIGTAVFVLKPVDDDVDENDETVRVNGSTTTSGLGVSSAATVTILDDDTRGVLLSATALTVREGESEDYTVWLDSEPTSTVTVTITGHSGSDLTLPNSSTLTFTDQNWIDRRPSPWKPGRIWTAPRRSSRSPIRLAAGATTARART